MPRTVSSLPALFAALALAAAPAAPPPPLSIGGSVVDAEDRPVAGAAVELVPAAAPAEERRLAAAGRALPEATVKARSDASGLFKLAAPAPGMFYVTITAAGSVPVAYLVAAVEDAELPPARLARVAGLGVRVLDAAGRPVAGARVRAERSFRSPGSFSGEPWQAAPRLGVTGADGRIALPRTEREALQIYVLAAGLVPGELYLDGRPGSPAITELRLAAACPRTVEVKDAAGKPAADVALRSSVWELGATDAAGSATVAAPCREELRLTLDAEGRTAPLVLRPWTGSGTAPAVRASLPPAAAQRAGGVAEKETRRPLAGALVWMDDAPGAFVRTDAKGAYLLPRSGPAGGRTTLRAAAAGYFPAWGSPRPAGAAPTLLLAPAAAVAGRVVDAAGKPVPGAGLRAIAQGRDAWRAEGSAWARSAADGRFRLAVLPRSALTLQARADGFVETTLSLAPIAPHGTRAALEVVLARGRAAFGRVVDGGDRPVGGAEVLLTPWQDATSGNPLARRSAVDSARLATTTGADGRFTLASLKAGSYDLTATAPGFAATVVRGLPLGKEAAPADLGTIILQPGVRQSGLVVDDKNRPLAGATVRLWQAPNGRGGRTRPGRSAQDVGEQQVQAGPDGRFTLVDLTPGVPLVLAAEQPGYLPGEPLRVAAPGESEVRLELAAAARLSGRVIDESGDPVAAMVIASPGNARPLNQMRDREIYGTSDELGRFVFEALEPGRAEVSAEGEGYLPSEPKAVELTAGRETSGVEIVVRQGAILEGQVLSPGGKPVDGARVGLERKEEMGFFARPRMNDSTSTDGDGRFRLSGIAPGSHTLVAHHDHYLRGVKDVEARAGSTSTVEIRLGDGLSLSGRVVDGGGSPLSGARVILNSRTDAKFVEAWTEGDGGFRFTGLSPGEQSLQASKEGYTDARLDDVRLVDAPLDGVELKLSQGGTIRGRIAGLTYPELMQVQVLARSDRRPAVGQVDFEGSYRIPGLAPGEWTVAAALPGTARTAQGRVEVPAAGVEVTLDLEFTGGLTLAGRVVQGGEPVVGASVGARPEGPGADGLGGGSTVSDGAGGFRLEGLKPGTYRLGVSRREAGLQHYEKETLELTESRADILIDIPASALVRGRVVEAGAEGPVAGAALSFQEEGSGSPSSFFGRGNAGETDAEGTFRVSAPPGRYRIEARKEGFSPGEAQVEVSAGGSPPEVRIRLSRASGLAIEVVGFGGLPPARVFAALVDASGRVMASGTYAPGEDGRIQISQAPPGSFLALVRASGSATVSTPVTVPGGNARVALLPPSQLTVRVPALSVDPQGGTLTIAGADGQPFRSVSWGGMVQQQWAIAGGQAVIEDLPPGRYTLNVTTAGGKSWQGTAVTGGGPVTQVLE